MYYLGQIIYSAERKEPILFGGINEEHKVVCYDKDLNEINIDMKETAPLVNTTTGKIVLGNLFAEEFFGVIKIKPEHQEAAKSQMQRFKMKVDSTQLKPLEAEDRK